MNDRLKVFLSSSQAKDELSAERESLRIVFDKEPLRSISFLWRFEDGASADGPVDHYLENVRESDALVILVASSLRAAVRDEFREAKKFSKPIFVFSRSGATASSELAAFKKNELHREIVSVEFLSLQDLSTKVEDALLLHCCKSVRRSSSPLLGPPPPSVSAQLPTPEERALKLLVAQLSSGSSAATKQSVVSVFILPYLASVDGPVTVAALRKNIVSLLGNDSPVSESDVRQAALASSQEGTTTSQGNDAFSISTLGRARLAGKLEADVAASEQLLLAFFERHKASLPGATWERYRSVVRFVIASLLYKAAAGLAGADLGPTGIESFDNNTLSQAISELLVQYEPALSHFGAWQGAVVDVLKSTDPSFISWMNRLRKAYWLLFVLGLDPDCHAYRRNHLRNYTFYLDSHIVLRALVGSGDESALCEHLLAVAQKLGVTLKISPELFAEVEGAFRAADRAYHSAGRDIARAAELYSALGSRSDVIEGFMRMRDETPEITWPDFLNRFYSTMSPEKLRYVVASSLGATILDNPQFDSNQESQISEIAGRLLERRHQPVSLAANSPESQKREFRRQQRLRQSEARQIAILFAARALDKDSSKQHWFVTFDAFVAEVSASLLSTPIGPYATPFLLRPSTALEMLIDASPEPISINVFRELLLSEAIERAADLLEEEVISQMLKSRVDRAVTDIKTLRLMFSDIINRPAINEAFEDMQKLKGRAALRAGEEVKDQVIEALGQRVRVLEKDLKHSVSEAAQARELVEKERGKAKYLKRQLRHAIPPKGPKERGRG